LLAEIENDVEGLVHCDTFAKNREAKKKNERR